MASSLSRLVIAGLSGDSGKTIASLSFLTALKRKGHSVSVFKKGPDYIDPAWLSVAAQSACRNLDTYMVHPDDVLRSFVERADESGIAVVEGNRGLFDGGDVEGKHSTAELAKLLGTPVVLVVDVAKTTRTVAAIVKGCVDFDPDVNIAGVILNRVAGKRHVAVVSGAIEEYCGLPVVGTIPKLDGGSTLIPGRHLGLVTPSEYGGWNGLQSTLIEIGERHLDVAGMIEIAKAAGPAPQARPGPTPAERPSGTKIGYFRDSVFTFYYPENLEALEKMGAELVPVSSLEDKRLPKVDGLYLGGGFPETHAEQLAGNRELLGSVTKAAVEGMPIYAECGGLIYLARSLEYEERVYRMAGVFPVDLCMHDKPVGHGYTSVRVDTPNPFYKEGTTIRGHEFHYTGPTGGLEDAKSCMEVERGVGLGEARDGLTRYNTLACYTHVHAGGTKDWASAVVSRAAEFAKKRGGGKSTGGNMNHSVKSIAL